MVVRRFKISKEVKKEKLITFKEVSLFLCWAVAYLLDRLLLAEQITTKPLHPVIEPIFTAITVGTIIYIGLYKILED